MFEVEESLKNSVGYLKMPHGEASAIDGKLKVWLTADKVWACSKCNTHLASHDDMKLRRYRGYYGSAYLFKKV